MALSSSRFQRFRIDPFDLKLFTLAVETGSITAAAQAARDSPTCSARRSSPSALR